MPSLRLGSIARVVATGCAIVGATSCAQPQAEMYDPAPNFPQDLDAYMTEHYLAAMDLETAVIQGHLADGRLHADWIATHRPHRDLPGARGPHAASVRVAAARGAAASDIEELASAAAGVAVGCGSCHAETQGSLDYLSTTPPEETESVTERMARHVWAADRMWEALVRHSDELWDSGVRVLQSSAVSAREVAWSPETESEVRPLVAELEEIAVSATAVEVWTERGDLVGSLLTTCSRCHEALGIDPLSLIDVGADRK